MKITKIETIRQNKNIDSYTSQLYWIWVRLHTDDGIIGLGETYPLGEPECLIIKSVFAPILIPLSAGQGDDFCPQFYAEQPRYGINRQSRISGATTEVR